MNRIHFNWLLAMTSIASLVVVIFASGCTKSAFKDLSFFRSGATAKESEKSNREIAEEIKNAFEGHGTSLTIWHDSFDDAQAASRQSGKPILADFTGGDWCHWCIKLENDVFEKEEFKQWARENVTLLKLNFPQRPNSPSPQNMVLAKKYNVTGYPTVLLLTSQGDVLGRLKYDADVNKWIRSADTILSM